MEPTQWLEVLAVEPLYSLVSVCTSGLEITNVQHSAWFLHVSSRSKLGPLPCVASTLLNEPSLQQLSCQLGYVKCEVRSIRQFTSGVSQFLSPTVTINCHRPSGRSTGEAPQAEIMHILEEYYRSKVCLFVNAVFIY